MYLHSHIYIVNYLRVNREPDFLLWQTDFVRDQGGGGVGMDSESFPPVVRPFILLTPLFQLMGTAVQLLYLW